MKVALVHDYLTQKGGEERVLRVLADMFPSAPIFCALYDKNVMGDMFVGRDIITSSMQKIPYAVSNHRIFSSLMPYTVEQFDFRDFDLVISSTASFMKGIITKPDIPHLCYCNTATRFLWDDSIRYLKDSFVPLALQPLASFILTGTRLWDRQASQRVDYFLANSEFVSKRIEKYYKRKAEVVYPPVDIKSFYSNDKRNDYYLMIGRLMEYKRFDLGILACNKLGLKLKVAGVGLEYERLKKIAGPTIEFLGYVSEGELRDLLSRARGFIFPQEEDFGIVQVEALASGCPIIAYRAGGALEVVDEKINGVFFDRQDVTSLASALVDFETRNFVSQDVVRSAQKFDISNFKKGIERHVARLVSA